MSGAPDAVAIWQVVEEWLASAESDRRAVGILLAADPPLHDAVAFHCQQATEKLLKGFLVLAQQRFRKTHDLDELSDLVRDRFPAIGGLVSQLDRRTVWNIAHRYPGQQFRQDFPSSAEIADAMATIERLFEAFRAMAPGKLC